MVGKHRCSTRYVISTKQQLFDNYRVPHRCADNVHFLANNAWHLDDKSHVCYDICEMDTAAEDLIRKKKRAKAEAFRRIAERRTERVLQSLRLLGQCSNRRSYEYSDEQIAKIFREIRSALRHAEQSFQNNRRNTGFRL